VSAKKATKRAASKGAVRRASSTQPSAIYREYVSESRGYPFIVRKWTLAGFQAEGMWVYIGALDAPMPKPIRKTYTADLFDVMKAPSEVPNNIIADIETALQKNQHLVARFHRNAAIQALASALPGFITSARSGNLAEVVHARATWFELASALQRALARGNSKGGGYWRRHSKVDADSVATALPPGKRAPYGEVKSLARDKGVHPSTIRRARKRARNVT
jgi:hypothetical protein